MDADPSDLLRTHTRVAVVGFSGTPGKDAHDVPMFVRARGYHVTPVNPNRETIEGMRCYPSLAAVPQPLDLVNVFRPSEEAPAVAEAAARAGAKALWLQLGIRSPEARRIAEEAGMAFVEDRCMKVELRRLHP